jgi:hypothetical protein
MPEGPFSLTAIRGGDRRAAPRHGRIVLCGDPPQGDVAYHPAFDVE